MPARNDGLREGHFNFRRKLILIHKKCPALLPSFVESGLGFAHSLCVIHYQSSVNFK